MYNKIIAKINDDNLAKNLEDKYNIIIEIIKDKCHQIYSVVVHIDDVKIDVTDKFSNKRSAFYNGVELAFMFLNKQDIISDLEFAKTKQWLIKLFNCSICYS